MINRKFEWFNMTLIISSQEKNIDIMNKQKDKNGEYQAIQLIRT